jgi:hypothetical protein
MTFGVGVNGGRAMFARRSTRLPSALRRVVLLLGLGYRVGELVQVGIERSKEPLDREPLDATAPSLDAGDVGRVHLKTCRKLLLRDPGLVPQDTERTAEHDQVNVSGVVAHAVVGRFGIPGQVAVSSRNQNIDGARAGRTAGRRGTESTNSRHASQATSSPAARLPCQSSPSGPPTTRRNP